LISTFYGLILLISGGASLAIYLHVSRGIDTQ